MAHPQRTAQQAPPANPYDPRDLQHKALQRWEQQQRSWAAMEANIRRRVPSKNRGAQLGGRNMELGVYKRRFDVENQTLIESAAPPPELLGANIWESMLRVHPGENAMRYVQMDKAEYPYPLYCKVIDSRRNDAEHQINTRIVHPKERYLGTVKEHSQLLESKSGPVSIGFPTKEYYSKQVARNISAIERQMPHFLVPRAYLEVCGKPPPWTFKEEEAAAAQKRVPPVAFHPPQTCSSANASHTLSQQGTGQKKCPSTVHDDPAAVASVVDGANYEVSVGEEVVGGPSLIISTTRILFFAEPGELAHGSVKIKNNGTTTVYYTWAPIQPVTELDEAIAEIGAVCKGTDHVDKDMLKSKSECPQAESNKGESAVVVTSDETGQVTTSARSGSGTEGEDGLVQEEQEVGIRQTSHGELSVPLRMLATKSNQSKAFFYLSSPLDGVILPDDEVIFPFSVRAAFAGRFTRHYELLMFPVMSQPLVVELCAFIRSPLPTMNALSDPVGEAIEAREAVDIQRHTLNALVARESIYDSSDIAKATEACVLASKAEEEAKEAEISRWRVAWNDSTYMALRVPFNRDIYRRLNAMHDNLSRTMDSCGMPLKHKEWNGSVQSLQAKICKLRDAASRNTLREALNFLLRAAVVCEQECEPLNLLFRRAAGATAFSILAQRVGQLDDSISSSLGIRARPPPQLNTFPPTSTWQKAANNQALASGRGNTKQGGRTRSYMAQLESSAMMSVLTEEQTNDTEPNTQEISVEPSIREEYKARLFNGMRRLVGDAVEQLCAILDASRNSIEAACCLPLMDVTMCTRSSDVRVIQNADDIEVDAAVDAMVPRKRK